MNHLTAELLPSELARNERWGQSLAARIAGCITASIRIRVAKGDYFAVTVDEVAAEWVRGRRLDGSIVCIPLPHVTAIAGASTGGTAGPVDAVAPSFRRLLAELSRRRQLVMLQCASDVIWARIHHVGLDYVETDGETEAILPISAIEMVIVPSLDSPQ